MASWGSLPTLDAVAERNPLTDTVPQVDGVTLDAANRDVHLQRSAAGLLHINAALGGGGDGTLRVSAVTANVVTSDNTLKFSTSGLHLANLRAIAWSSAAIQSGAKDLLLERAAAGELNVCAAAGDGGLGLVRAETARVGAFLTRAANVYFYDDVATLAAATPLAWVSAGSAAVSANRDLFLERGATGVLHVCAAAGDGGLGAVVAASVVGMPTLPSYTVAGAPAASTAGRLLYCTDEVGGACVAYDDGAAWRRVDTNAVIADS